MKVAIPTANGRLCPHFGHCETFSIIDIDDSGAILAMSDETPPPHEPGVLPQWLKSLGVNHIVAGGMGGRAQALFCEFGIEVTTGAAPLDPQTLAGQLVKGDLVTGDNLCDH